jgi:hypothetical protein
LFFIRKNNVLEQFAYIPAGEGIHGSVGGGGVPGTGTFMGENHQTDIGE